MSKPQANMTAVIEFLGLPPRKMVSCPLHEDRNPSMSVSYDKAVWMCFSCGMSGDAWRLLNLVTGLEYEDVFALADKEGLTADTTPRIFSRFAVRTRPKAKNASTYRPRFGRR